MIVVSRLNGSRFAVNPDLIERIQASPDTTLVLVDGTTYVVREELDAVIDMIAHYRARVIALAHAPQEVARPIAAPVPLRSADALAGEAR
ncbi:flagellar protein FlbD [Diaminobutyricimonas aerilata]|uniref:Flagellar protein FlbD n=1 Tax=Diaminobutyricimonas aerilata TaxID=1162967 RepID=A0A2M9CN11_9MICO|nr:flagellar FlbD family protein [Diaminobutyricimonas aerilata]PJJ73281.1 flagellar protein FlbD [Diaminobutyricimonas aerilata]